LIREIPEESKALLRDFPDWELMVFPTPLRRGFCYNQIKEDISPVDTNSEHAHQEMKRGKRVGSTHTDTDELTLINEISRRISASLDLENTLNAIVKASAELIPCSLAEVSLWDEKTDLLTTQAIECEPGRSYPIGQAYPPGEGYTGWVVRHRRPLFIPDVEARKDIRPHILPGEKPFKAYAGLPLMAGDRFHGVLVLVADQVDAFNERDLRLLRTLADQAAIAIQNARVYEELARRNRELSALFQVAETANRAHNMEELLQDILDDIVEVTNADGGGIRIFRPDEEEVVLIAHHGLSEKYIKEASVFPLTEEIVGWVARSGQATLSHDMWTDERVSPEVRDLLKDVGHRSLTQVPLKAQDEILGTLGVTAESPGYFSEEDLKLLTAVGQQIGVAVANLRLRQERLSKERQAAVGRVAASVAHDLRSPLGGILRSAEFLARPELKPETRQKLSQAIVSLAKRLTNSTQEILDYVRGSKLTFEIEQVHLPEYLDETLTLMEVDFSDRGIEVIKDYQYSGPVLLDPDRMSQVIINIATNARDAMPRGGTFMVSTKKANKRIEMRFSDTGPGVSEEISGRIFDPFFSEGKRDGAGLGLAIAHRIVQEHQGELVLECGENQGATFLVTLPLPEVF
jgi:signal transduction histidine kinase